MNRVLRPSDRAAVVGVIDPDAYGTGTETTGWIAMADFERLMAVVMAGELGASATLNAKIEQAQDDGGTGAKDIDGLAISELTQGGDDDSDQQAIINVVGEDLDVDNGFTHVRLSMTVGTAGSDASGVVLGFDARYAPGADHDLDSVAQIV